MGTVSSILSSQELLLTIPVVDILAWYGKRVDHRGYMYYSPFREESEPSMRVSVNPADGTWMWADYGGSSFSGKKVDGGGCIELVRRLGGFSSRREAFRELERIASAHGMNVIRQESLAVRKAASRPVGIVVDSVRELESRRLLNYALSERGISREVLSRFCREVTYHPRSDSNRRFTVIGFPNNAGGFVLRGTGSSRGSKRNTLSGITTISPDGRFTDGKTVCTPKCAVFEGFMDFLSYLQWKGSQEPGIDVCVLNSTSMVSYARSWIESHDAVRLFLDNDEAGENATRSVEQWCLEAGRDFKDGRSAYQGHKDINEAWLAELGRRNGKDRNPGPKFRL